MSLTEKQYAPKAVVARKDFQSLLDALLSQKYEISGPVVRDNAVVYDRISQTEDLPIGWIDRQNHGTYHLSRNKKKSLFGCINGSHTWKKFLYPMEKLVLEARRDGKKIELQELPNEEPRQALIGVRSCDLHALQILDKVLIEGPYADLSYSRRRKNLFIVAVNCSRASGNCFCVSMDTGPKATSGFDLALTEVIDDDNHYFVCETGSESGLAILKQIPHHEASVEELAAADKAIQNAVSRMGRSLKTDQLPEMLQRNFDNPEWEKVGQRCLSCGNCTMVCPTCFCTTMEDRTDLSGQVMQRWRKIDSCHTVEFSYIHGGSIRSSGMSRYRQWMMHKLAYWPEQFGTFGCVGCGRCISWCPVGIDITEEARTIENSE